MDGLERDIATYLTIGGQVFIAPQYNIEYEMNEGGACPDFVALDFSCKEVVVVEVTGAANWKPLAKRVHERETRWFSPVRRKLLAGEVISPAWNIRFLGFVRRTAVDPIKAQFVNDSDVTFYNVEKAVILWDYWNDRIKDGLPGNRGKAYNASA